jgi:uncharacterized membrane protein
MSRKFIENEGRRWTELGIVTPQQYEQILHLYTEKKHAIGLVPILGSILVALGILSFVAANWQDIPQLLRLIIIIAAMVGFYGAGETLLKREHGKLGISLIGIGLITFGAGIVLVAQMFHLEAYDITSWMVWGAAGIVLTYLYRSRYLFLISLLILTFGQLYSINEFHQFSYVSAIISLVGLGIYVWKQPNQLLAWMLSASFISQALMLVGSKDWKFIWVFIPLLALYTWGDWVKKRDLATPMQSSVIIFTFAFDLFIVMFTGAGEFLSHSDTFLAPWIPFILASVVLFAISMLFKIRSGRVLTGFEWILTPPLLYVTPHSDVMYLLVTFFFSLFLLWRGYVEEWRFKINLGTVLFLISTMTAYSKLTWDFMDKSLFFIIGGVLLLLLSWVLNNRRRQFIQDTKEGSTHE